MKTDVARLLLLAVWLAAGVPLATAATGGPAKGQAPAVKVEEVAKVEGMEVARAGGGLLGVAMVGGTFKISFYDAKRKPAQADVSRALLRWDPKYKLGSERVVLTLGADGKSLVSPKPIRPPYAFKLFITLLKDATGAEESAAGEVLVIDFRG
jgi:hypothetical protein